MGNGLAVGTISQVVQTRRSELITLKKRVSRTKCKTMDRETWESAQEAIAIDDSDREIFERLFTLYDKRGGDEVIIREFLVGLATITNNTIEERIQLAMELYDDCSSTSTAFLSKTETKAVLNSMNKTCNFFGDTQLSHEQIEELVESVFETYATELQQGTKLSNRHAPDFASHPIMEIFTKRRGTNQNLAKV
mmetsp:Transcript_4279/g.6512  ORF Transcript_4279/g.6512 Transcript_4279/m.6512 type:complete len:193 (-) Transcript_4279:179-757(-)